ncbi:hypothetical protein FB45DRAFT_1104189 [Roridomyces roridus]|uniref:DUF6534 domain-containing protein n=1 Tax=Roridomyces roridus TaxID=1738132 RepID=A0AAD7BCW7_9AGAR|nr:hypothetical protein FB45DRAFT_1104189 [Roridomyces roridus]
MRDGSASPLPGLEFRLFPLAMSESATAPPAVPAGPPDVTLLFGPLLLGVLLNTLLYGVLLVQSYIYYHRYQRDRPWFRYLVLYLLIMETANWVSDIGLIYEPLILRYGDQHLLLDSRTAALMRVFVGKPEALITSPVMLRPDAVMTVLISMPIQIFVAWRVRVITNSTILPAIICLLAIVALGGGISVTTMVTLRPNFSQFGEFHPEVITWLAASAACDVFLTGSLVISLWVRKGPRNNPISTDSYLNKIIRLTVQTGAITAAASLADMILYIAMPDSTMNFLIDFPLSKLYSNSLVSTLNTRPWREDVSNYDAPNVLFEQTPNGASSGPGFRSQGASQGSFSLTTRRSAYHPSGVSPIVNVTTQSLSVRDRSAGSGRDTDGENAATSDERKFDKFDSELGHGMPMRHFYPPPPPPPLNREAL